MSDEREIRDAINRHSRENESRDRSERSANVAATLIYLMMGKDALAALEDQIVKRHDPALLDKRARVE